MFGGRRRRREEQFAAKDRWRVARKLMDQDVTVLGEQVAELHLDTLGDDLDPAAHDHYRRALENHDQAKQFLATSETADNVVAVEQVVADARFHRAAVLAVISGPPVTLGWCPRKTASGSSRAAWTGSSRAARSRAPTSARRASPPATLVPTDREHDLVGHLGPDRRDWATSGPTRSPS